MLGKHSEKEANPTHKDSDLLSVGTCYGLSSALWNKMAWDQRAMTLPIKRRTSEMTLPGDSLGDRE